MLSRKDFIAFYRSEVDFSRVRGINISEGHKKELEEMFELYNTAKNDKEFTELMTRKGYGLV